MKPFTNMLSAQRHIVRALQQLRQFSPTTAGPRHYVILGPPGGGKGTVCSRLEHDYGFAVLGSGDMIRKQIADKTELGVKAKEFVNKGNLVPDELVKDLVLDSLRPKMNDSWILDGFPRTISQADSLQQDASIAAVIYVDVPFETIIERLADRLCHLPSGRIYHREFNPPKREGLDDLTGEPLQQRDDDKPETVRARLEEYQKQTAPLVDYYRSRGILQHFQGTKTNEIYPKITDYLDQFHHRMS